MSGTLRILCLPGKAFKGGNPYFRLFCEGLEAAGLKTVEIKSRSALLGRFDVVHVHFPEHYITEQSLPNAFKWGGFYLVFLLRAKLAGKTIVWSVHDVHPFKERHVWLLRPFMAVFRALVDAYVFMSDSSAREFQATFPSQARKPRCRVSHSAYPVSEPDRDMVAIERARLSEDGSALVVGFLGNIKAYKNVAALRLLPAALSDGRRVRILIAGSADRDSLAETQAVTRDLGPARVVRRDGRLSDADLDLLIRSVDVVFLPYTKGWNSGLATLVLCNGGRVVGSDLPVFADMVREYGAPWIYQYATASDLAAVLETVSRNLPEEGDRARLSCLLSRSHANAVSADLRRFYERIRVRRPQPDARS